MKSLTKKAVANSMRKEAEKESTNLRQKLSNIFKLMEFMKKDGKNIKGGRCMRGKDGNLGFSDKDGKRIRKNHVEEIMSEENDWNYITEASMIEGPVKSYLQRNGNSNKDNETKKRC